MSTGHGKGTYYYVEARISGGPIQDIHGHILTKEWTRVHTVQVPDSSLRRVDSLTVPDDTWCPLAAERGLMSAESAYSLAVQFQTGFPNGLCVETRLVQVKLEWSCTTTETGQTEPFSLFEHLRYPKVNPREEPAGLGSETLANAMHTVETEPSHDR